ncbi:MAG: sulfatase-like hydrolase/transferase [Bacteroidota bacterium]
MKLYKNHLSIFIICLCISSCTKPRSVPESTPNILLIVSDDHGSADMSCLGRLEDVQTPNLDALAKSGIRFTEAHASSPICSPSRMAIMTGVHNQRFGTYWYGGKGIHDQQYPTIAELLKKKEYATGYIGKVHYGSGEYDADPENRNFPLNHGFDYFFGHTSARKHYLRHSDAEEEAFTSLKEKLNRKGQTLRKQSFWRNKNKVDTLSFSTQMIGNEAKAFIENHQDTPFFLQVSFNAVHNFTHQLPETYLKERGLQGYHDWDPKTEEYYDWYQKGRFPNNPEGREQYLGQLYYLDQEIGKLMQSLEELGLRKNTLVIYIADNGGSTPIYANNTPLRGSKYVLYEGGVKVPMIFSFPGKIKSEQVMSNWVSAMDILPSICSFTGVEKPQVLDGLDLYPLVTGVDLNIGHDTLFFDTEHERAIKTADWKWHEAISNKSAIYEMVELELGAKLRNLKNDPGEKEDLSEEESEKAAALKAALENWQDRIKGEN